LGIRNSSKKFEQGDLRICNSRRTFCACFRSVAGRCRRWCFGHSAFAARYAELRSFAAKIPMTVENDREKFYFQFLSLARAINSLNFTSRLE
jgi:hypothetical protein